MENEGEMRKLVRTVEQQWTTAQHSRAPYAATHRSSWKAAVAREGLQLLGSLSARGGSARCWRSRMTNAGLGRHAASTPQAMALVQTSH